MTMISSNSDGYFELEVTINGMEIRRTVPTNRRLLDFIRDDLRLTGTKEVCGEGECGACTVILDGKLVNACLILTVEAHESEVVTIEGIAGDDRLTPLQQAFIDEHAVQCGYCIPGMIVAGYDLLQRNPHPRREDIKRWLAGNICRCTGYQKIIDAIETAGREQTTPENTPGA
jgi:carbon-monoxide dehydrogenase small subunit